MMNAEDGLSRREWLAAMSAGATAVLGLSTSGCENREGAARTSAGSGREDDVIWMSTAALARAIRTHELSSETVVSAYLSRIEAVNSRINAVVQVNGDRARAAAREADRAIARREKVGPLHGVPMTIKDSIDTQGVITAAGTRGRARFVPDVDATVVKRLRAAGAILIGKTNTPEITLAGETDNLVYGRTSNPYDLSRSSGGSSGGPAAIVAAGGSPFDIGSDSAGSIRLPCSFCGVAGIKPTSGRVPQTGHIMSYDAGTEQSWNQLGPIARNVDDLALILPLIVGSDWRDPYIVPVPLGNPRSIDIRQLRVSFHVDNGLTTTTPEISETVRSAARALSRAGVEVHESRPPALEEFYSHPRPGDGGALFRSILKDAGTVSVDNVSPFLRFFFDPAAKSASAADKEAYFVRVSRFRSQMLGFMEQFDAIICPAFGSPAAPHGFWNKVRFPLDVSYTEAYNVTGWPAAVVRCGTSPVGLPLGVQIVTRPFREDVALALAIQLEHDLGGFKRPAL